MTTSVLERLNTMQGKASTRFRELVFAAAQGHDVDEHELRLVLADAGKSLDAFREGVRVVRRRQRAVADLRRADKLEHQRPELDATQREALAEHDALVKRHREEREQADRKLRDASSAVSTHYHRMTELRRRGRSQLESTAASETKNRIVVCDQRSEQLRAELDGISRDLMQCDRATMEQKVQAVDERRKEIESELRSLADERTHLVESQYDPQNCDT